MIPKVCSLLASNSGGSGVTVAVGCGVSVNKSCAVESSVGGLVGDGVTRLIEEVSAGEAA